MNDEWGEKSQKVCNFINVIGSEFKCSRFI